MESNGKQHEHNALLDGRLIYMYECKARQSHTQRMHKIDIFRTAVDCYRRAFACLANSQQLTCTMPNSLCNNNNSYMCVIMKKEDSNATRLKQLKNYYTLAHTERIVNSGTFKMLLLCQWFHTEIT